MRSHEEDVAEAVIEAILRTLWAFRVELTLVAIYGALDLLAKPRPRQRKRMDRPSRTRSCWCWRFRRSAGSSDVAFAMPASARQWARAVRSARILSLEDRVPTVRRMKDIPAGQRFEVRIPPREQRARSRARAEVIAAALRVREVRVHRVPDNASRAQVVIARRDPLAVGPPLPWPARRLRHRQPLGTDPGRRRGGRAGGHRSAPGAQHPPRW